MVDPGANKARWEKQTISTFVYCLACLFAYARRKISPKITLFIDWLHIGALIASVTLVSLVLTRYRPWKSTAMHWTILILSAIILYDKPLRSFEIPVRESVN